ncbi:antibiotic biosynthesis monooxygenase [Epibacterium ulvae]|uniref:putative quinol monooxygenase n=1 Tax=Epibacterium ulvae TaxID=1156985 RepID=UPI001BFC3AA2|nr:antibiotic biosynthesis monooxygenase [Epibacterium ulvae]MBT8155403.1 antibiotic biosynthesis monooxygenase [Epibacterium ulvae]
MTEAIIVTLVPEVACFDELLALLGSILEETRAFDGCSMAHVCHSKPHNEIVLVQMWQDSEAHDDYLNWRVEQGIFDKIADLVAEEPIHKPFHAL